MSIEPPKRTALAFSVSKHVGATRAYGDSPMTMTAAAPNPTSLRKIEHFIGGAYVAGTSGRFGDVYDPSAGHVAARVQFAGKTDVENAIASSAAAFVGWSKMSALARARVLMKYRDLLDAHAGGRNRAHRLERTRQSRRRRACVAPTRHRSRRVRDGHPASAQRRFFQRRRDGRRYALAASADRRRRGYYTI